MATPNAQSTRPVPVLDSKTIFLLSIICAATVGNIYYNQPLLERLATYFQTSEKNIGVIAMLSQVGYGVGVLLIVPLGDILERRSLIMILLGAVGLSLLLAATSPTLEILALSQLLIGITTISPQIIMPFAAALAPPSSRALILGKIQGGLLIGILLARTVSGTMAAIWGWRSIYYAAAVLMVLMSFVVRKVLPKQELKTRLKYFQLLKSMLTLFFSEPSLRRTSLVSALNFAAFTAFWTTLSFLLQSSFHYGPGVVGMFGIIGVVGAMVAPVAGKMADAKGAEHTQKISLMLTLLSFGIFAFATTSIVALVIGVIVLDAGIQMNHIANQADVFSLSPEAGSRLNGVYMFLRFTGGALGSITGAWAWEQAQWNGVCILGTAVSVLAFAPFFIKVRRRVKN